MLKYFFDGNENAEFIRLNGLLTANLIDVQIEADLVKN